MGLIYAAIAIVAATRAPDKFAEIYAVGPFGVAVMNVLAGALGGMVVAVLLPQACSRVALIVIGQVAMLPAVLALVLALGEADIGGLVRAAVTALIVGGGVGGLGWQHFQARYLE